MLNLKHTRHDCSGLRLDANETLFLSRALEYIEPTIYKVLYAENSAFRLFPMSSAGGPAAKSILYRTMDGVGKARVIASYADDLPKVTAFISETPSPVRSLGASYGWSLQDIRSAMTMGINLEGDEAELAARAHNNETNRIAWNGDAAHGLPGLKTNADIPTAAATTGNWGAATAEQIIADITEMLTTQATLTSGVEQINTIVMPPGKMAILISKSRSTTSDTTVLGFLRQNFPGITFESAVETIDWSGGDDAMIGYNRSESKLYMAVPQPYEEMPVERHALRFEVATHSRVGGLIVRYPKSVSIRTGI